MGDGGVIGGQGVLQGVLGAEVVHAHHHAGEAAAEGHQFPGLLVLAVGAGGSQVPAHGLNGLQGQHVPHQVLVLVDVGLGGMEEGVKPLEGGELGGDGQHEVRVHDGQDGEGGLVAAAHLLVGGLVGDHGPGVHLRAGAGGGGNGHNGQGLVLHLLAAAGAAVDIIPEVALVGGHHGDGFGRVDAAAAPQAQDEVTAVGPGKGGPVHHSVHHRVGGHLIKDGVFHPGLGQLVLHGVQIPVGPGGLAAGNHDEGFLARQTLLVQLLNGPLAENQIGGDREGKTHDQYSFRLLLGRKCVQFHKYHSTMEAPWGQAFPPRFPHSSPGKNFVKFVKIPLYNPLSLCYNNLAIKQHMRQ